MDTRGSSVHHQGSDYDDISRTTLALCHPRFKSRADRLDLITNKMIGLKIAIGGKNYPICDLSESGFSYAVKVPIIKNLSYKQVKEKVGQIAAANYGTSLKCLCYFENLMDRGGFEVNGTIKNHHLFLILSADEIRQTVTAYLQNMSIRRSHDPQGFFKKLDFLLTKSHKTKGEGANEVALGIAVNTTFRNLISEIGAPDDIFDSIYQGYINKAVFLKYGVAVDRKEAAGLIKFAKYKNAMLLHREQNEQNLIKKHRLDLIRKLNARYGFKEFVLVVWKNCLTYFGITPKIELPKITSEKIASCLKDELMRFNGHLEKLADSEFMEGECNGLEHYLCDGLYWHLIEKNKKYFDREVIRIEIRKIIRNSYEACLIE